MQDKTSVKNDQEKRLRRWRRLLKLWEKHLGGHLHELNNNKRVKIAQRHVQEMTIVLSEIPEVGWSLRKVGRSFRIKGYHFMNQDNHFICLRDQKKRLHFMYIMCKFFLQDLDIQLLVEYHLQAGGLAGCWLFKKRLLRRRGDNWFVHLCRA